MIEKKIKISAKNWAPDDVSLEPKRISDDRNEKFMTEVSKILYELISSLDQRKPWEDYEKAS